MAESRTTGRWKLALLARREDSPTTGIGPLGVRAKRVRVGAGETIRLDLPPPAPDMSHQREGSVLTKDADHGVMAILAERRVSLILTTRPVE